MQLNTWHCRRRTRSMDVLKTDIKRTWKVESRPPNLLQILSIQWQALSEKHCVFIAWWSQCFCRCSISAIPLLCSRWPKHPSVILHTAPSVLVSCCLLKAEQPSASQCIRISLLEKPVRRRLHQGSFSLKSVCYKGFIFSPHGIGELFVFQKLNYRHQLQCGLHNRKKGLCNMTAASRRFTGRKREDAKKENKSNTFSSNPEISPLPWERNK